ncbi:MAG: hypothetical protein LBD08_07135, partial [Treponema sp.]|nr:hypothetical protein [Treponema sp.]
MKKLILILALFLAVLSWSSGQEQGAMDLILLLDTSSALSGSFLELRDYLTGPFLQEFLRIGDTFHLISVADAPRREISRRVEGIGDVETIISRLYLMYPLEPASNITAALEFIGQYVSTLPGARRKIVVLLTSKDRSIKPEAIARLNRPRVDFHLVQFPFTGSGPYSGRPSLRRAAPPRPQAEIAAAQPQAVPESRQTPAQSVPAQTETRDPQPQAQRPVQPAATPPANAAAQAPARNTQPQTAPQAQRPAQPAAPPANTAAQAQEQQPVQPVSGGSGNAKPLKTALPVFSAPGLSLLPAPAPSSLLPLFFTTLGLGMAAFLTFLVLHTGRRLQRFPNKTMAYVAGRSLPPKTEPYPLTEHAAKQRQITRLSRLENGPGNYIDTKGILMLSLFVEDQNTATGRRNIHAIKPGYTYTIGGGNSDFLIFLVPLPPHIAE